MPPARLDIADPAITKDVAALCQAVYKAFLLRHDDPNQLYRMVRDSALEFATNPSVDDDFSRLKLEPWNAIRRLELAAGYAAFLKRSEDLGLLNEAVERCAAQNNLRGLMAQVPHDR